MTINDLISVAASRLKSARIVEPRLEAESLLAHVLKRDLAWLLAHPETSVAKTDGRQFSRLVAKRTRHVPFAQLIGEKGFYGRVFLVTKDVLIPRPETELLIEAVLRSVAPAGMPPGIPVGMKGGVPAGATIIDVGTGSGVIGLTLAAELPGTKAFLYDISAKALKVARTNARQLKLGRRARLAKLDILRSRLPEPSGPTILVANLPYLPLAAWKSAQPEVRVHEPKLALVSGKNGLDHYRALFRKLKSWKRKPALLAIEAEPGQFKELLRMTLETMPQARTEVFKDLHGDERILIARA